MPTDMAMLIEVDVAMRMEMDMAMLMEVDVATDLLRRDGARRRCRCASACAVQPAAARSARGAARWRRRLLLPRALKRRECLRSRGT